MACYVDAEAEIAYLKRVNCEKCHNDNGTKCNYCGIADALMALEEADEADVVEVVRCKDCVNCEVCPDTLLWCNEHESLRHETDFCNRGERKEK